VDVVLWILQVLLALLFVMHGRMMISPPEKLPSQGLAYIQDLPSNLRRLIGILEILAAIGLILPMLLNILPVLTPLAALGLVFIMGGAAIYHIPRKEYSNIVLNLVLLVLAAFVAYGRFSGIGPL
jgi:uncharacterized membrane protein YphA (DoxX/SURF4 family)